MRRLLLLIAPLLALLCLLSRPVLASAAGPIPVTDLRAQKSGMNVILTWTHGDAAADHYEVWWSDSPYAAIGDAGMAMIATVTPTGTPSELTYTDTASGLGNTVVNSFYAVRGVTASGEASALSNWTGEFDFGLPDVGPLPVVDHCGIISADEVWGPNAMHRLSCSVTIDPAAKLIILAGAEIQASSSVVLNIHGGLVAQGSTDHPVTFTNNTGDVSGEKWQGIYLGGSGTLDYVIIEYVSAAQSALRIASNDVTVRHSTIRHSGAGVYVQDTAKLADNTITDNSGWGVSVGSGVAAITGNTITNNAGGVYLQGGATLIGNTITNNTGYAVKIALDTVKDCQLTGNVFTSNGHDAVGIEGGSLSGEHVWGDWLLDYEVDVNSYLQVGSSSPGSLTLPAGVILHLITLNPSYPANIVVIPDSSLTLLPGTTLHFNGGEIQIRGSLMAQGTVANPITFTNLTEDESGEKWEGMYISGSAILDHVIVEYSSYSYGAIEINSSDVYLTNSLIRNNREGVYVTAAVTLEGNTISNNTGSHNGGIWIADGSGTTLINNIISHNEGPGVNASVPVTLTGNTISDNDGYAVSMNAAAVRDSLLLGNVINGNSHDAIAISGAYYDWGWVGGVLKGDHVWGSWLTAFDIDFFSRLVVAETGRLTLPAGLTLRFVGGSAGYGGYSSFLIQNGGQLIAQGSPTAPIVFTVQYDTTPAGYWTGFRIYGATLLDYVTIEHAYSNQINSDAVTITHSTIRYTHGAGLTISGSATVRNNTIAYNSSGGIYVYDSSASIHHNNIYGNQGYGLYNGASSVVDARYNWWGSNSGPAPYGSGNGINYATCWDPERYVYYICDYYVDVDPWIGKEISTGAQLGNNGPLSNVQAIIADPVNTANGNYTHQHTDIMIPTRGLSLDFTRAYNSFNPQAGSLGYGWTYNWNLSLSEDATDGSVTIAFGDGHTEHWTWTGAAYDGGPGVFGILIKNGDGSFDLLLKDQTKYHFDAVGKLAWAEDKNANRTTLAYDGNGRLHTITEPAGRTLTLEYASPVNTSLITRITDHTARSVQYVYNSAGDLVSVTDVTGHDTTITYDADHRLLTMTDANTHRFVRNVYDSGGRVAKQYDALDHMWLFAYDEPAHKTLVTDPRGYVTIYQYDGEWRLLNETDPLGFATSYTYDTDNNRTQVTDKRGYATHFSYDNRGNVTLITDALSGTRSFTYDTISGRNNLLSETDPRGHTTSYEYDAHSNLLTRIDALAGVTTWAYNAYGQVTAITDANGHTTTFGYDALGYGNRTSTTDPLSHTTAAAYDSAGRKLSVTDPLGHTTTYTYDAANRVLTINEPLGKTTAYTYDAVGNRMTATENGARTTHYVYDAKNRLTGITDPLGHTTTYGYDTVDNQTSVTDPLGHAVTITYDALNRRTAVKDALNYTTGYEYDANGNRTKVTDANSRTTLYIYDGLNRLTGVTDAAGGAVGYGYDAAGNRTSMTDANSHTTIYAYDALNRLISATDPLSHVTGYGYDAAGNRTSEIRPDGTVVSYTYDAADRLTGVSYPGGSVAYDYDAVGNRTSMTDATGATTYAYDALDRVTQIAGPNGTLDYGYDLFDNRTSVTYPGSLTVNYAYDLADRLSTVTDYGSRTTQYAYDDANRLTTLTYPNGVLTTYTYDDADRLLSILHAHPTHGTITSANYTLDAVGNRTSLTDPDGVTGYTYDNLYRLTQVAYPDGETVTYTYDAMGNRSSLVSSVHGATTYSYDAGDRLLSYTDADGTVSLSWDDNGRMTGKGSATYAYDPLDRLVQVVDGGTTVQFAYDGDDARLRKTVNGTATDYLQDKAAPLPVVLSETTGGAASRYIYGLDLLEQIDPAGDPAFYHTDGLGSTRALSDASGQRTDAYSYDAFGAVRSHAGGSGQPFRFAGEEADPETGTVFLRARYLDTLTGLFTTQDAYPLDVTRPDTIHRYVYVGQNPVNRVDPTGKCWLLGPLSTPCELVNNPNYGASASQADTEEAVWALIGLGIGNLRMLPVDFVRSMSSSPGDVFQIKKTSKFLRAWMSELKLTLRDANPINVLRFFDTPLWRDFVRLNEQANPWLKHLNREPSGDVLSASADWGAPASKRR